MPIFHRNKKPQVDRPPSDQTWRRPRSNLVDQTNDAAFTAHMGAFVEDAIPLADALMARDRREDDRHD